MAARQTNRKSVSKTTLATTRRPVKSASAVKPTTKKVVTSRAKKEELEQVQSSFASQITPVRNFIKNKKGSYLIIGVLALLLLGFLAYKYLVVAWVDGKSITRFTYYRQLSSKYGKDTREQLISEQLIKNEADKRHVSVSQQEIDAEIKKIEDQQGGGDQLNQALAAQGLTIDELKRQVRYQLLIQKMFGGSVNVTSDEIDKYMTDNKDSLPAVKSEDASGAAKLKQNVADQLKQQKLSKTFNAWLKDALQSKQVSRISL